MQLEIVERMADKVANKINTSLRHYLPKVAVLMKDFENFSKKFDNKIEVDTIRVEEEEKL
jgi:hypothetical protein